MPIPRILHHVWPGDDPFRSEFHDFRRSWIAHHPDWSAMFWRGLPQDRAASDEVERGLRNICDSDQYSAVVKSDVLRLWVLLAHGGLYVDTDFECLKSFDELMRHDGFFCGYEDRTILCPSLMAAPAGHPFVRTYLEAAVAAVRATTPEIANREPHKVTGPHLLTQIVKSYRGDDLKLHDRSMFYPVHCSELYKIKHPTPGAFAKHYWSGGWTKPTQAAAPKKEADAPVAKALVAAIAPPARTMRPGDEEFHRWYGPQGTGSGPGSSPQYTSRFQVFLQAFLREHGIRSVLDYGCGDWQWARQVDWTGVSYCGVEIVPGLVDRLRRDHGDRGRFELVDPETWWPSEPVDLVICKDVLQHLPNAEALDLMNRVESVAERILWINDRNLSPVQTDTHRGGFRRLDLTQPPFSRSGEIIFEFGHKPDDKVAFLWSRGTHHAPVRHSPPSVSPEAPQRAPMLDAKAVAGAVPLHAKVYSLFVDAALLQSVGIAEGAQHNPSVAVHKGELRAVVRVVANRVTTNFLGRINDRWRFEGARLMRDRAPGERNLSAATHGYQDCRLFELRGRLAASASVCDHVAGDVKPKIAILELEDDGSIVAAHVQPSHRHEKNWMPVANDDRVRFVYSTDPTVTAEYDPDRHAVSPRADELPECASALRGSSQLIGYEDGYLAVVHEVHAGSTSPVYLHRFVHFDRDLRLVNVGQPFYFQRLGIEFCAGLARWKGLFVLSFGVEDREAKLALVSDETVEQLLTPRAQAHASGATSAPAKDAMRVLVCHSPHARCGVREYGAQLDRSLSEHASIETCTHNDLARLAATARPRDVLLIHFEPTLVPSADAFLDTLRAARARGARVVFCCHRYSADVEAVYGSVVDAFVLHRAYAPMPRNAVVIPLGCPRYERYETREQLRGRIGLPKDKIVVTTVGFLAAWKRMPEIADAVLRASTSDVLLQMHTPWPFLTTGAADEEAKVRAAIAKYEGRVLFSTEFVSEKDLLDRVHASDLGFLFHPVHTGSVSAATKQFVSARCPLVITASSHASDLEQGIVRADTTDPEAFAREVVRVATDAAMRANLREEMVKEYERINMDAVAQRYVDAFRKLAS